jgi:hypothetical protein
MAREEERPSAMHPQAHERREEKRLTGNMSSGEGI